jgi:hypothetical protein
MAIAKHEVKPIVSPEGRGIFTPLSLLAITGNGNRADHSRFRMSGNRTTQAVSSRFHGYENPFGFGAGFEFQFVNGTFDFYFARFNFLSPNRIGKVFGGKVMFLRTGIV